MIDTINAGTPHVPDGLHFRLSRPPGTRLRGTGGRARQPMRHHPSRVISNRRLGRLLSVSNAAGRDRRGLPIAQPPESPKRTVDAKGWLCRCLRQSARPALPAAGRKAHPTLLSGVSIPRAARKCACSVSTRPARANAGNSGNRTCAGEEHATNAQHATEIRYAAPWVRAQPARWHRVHCDLAEQSPANRATPGRPRSSADSRAITGDRPRLRGGEASESRPPARSNATNKGPRLADKARFALGTLLWRPSAATGPPNGYFELDLRVHPDLARSLQRRSRSTPPGNPAAGDGVWLWRQCRYVSPRRGETPALDRVVLVDLATATPNRDNACA